MKKWLVVCMAILVLLFLAGSYFFIPKQIRISKIISVKANEAGLFRFLSKPDNWQKWWPEKAANGQLELNGFTFNFDAARYNSVGILIERDQQTDSSVLQLLPVNIDLVKIVWNVSLHTNANPFFKVIQYLRAKKIAGSCEKLLVAMSKYASDPGNLYGIRIRKENVPIGYMVSIKKPFDRRPTDQEIYEIIASIRKRIQQAGATEEGQPFCNITAVDSAAYELVVGVPVTDPVPDSGIFLSKKMLKNGNMLTAEVTGGHASVEEALQQFDYYAKDYQYQNIAIPFQIFITDRLLVKDTSKWITRIGYPIL